MKAFDGDAVAVAIAVACFFLFSRMKDLSNLSLAFRCKIQCELNIRQTVWYDCNSDRARYMR